MLESKEKETIPCEEVDDLLDTLNNKFLLLWVNNEANVIKLDKPNETLYFSKLSPNPSWQPIVLDVDTNDSSSSQN
jgi:hypothetical protein